LASNLHLLGERLLILQHPLHHWGTQIEIGVDFLLSPINLRNLGKQKIHSLHEMTPLLVLTTLRISHCIEEEL